MRIEFVIIFLFGLVIGMFTNNFLHSQQKLDGTLRIDHSNFDKDVYRFEIDDIENLDKKNRIILHIDHNAHLSHE